MSYGVGLSAMKLNGAGRSSRASMPLRKACLEACEERASKTRSLDRKRSKFNEYHLPDGVENGEQLADWFERKLDERAAEIEDEIFEAEWEERKPRRRQRKDALPAVTFTMVWEKDVSDKWTAERKRKEVLDAVAAWSDWAGHEPDAWVVHNDEGSLGVHIFDRPLVDGDYNGKAYLNKTSMRSLHKVFVQGMRDRGHEVDEHLSPDEREARGLPKRPKGLSANEYREWCEAIEEMNGLKDEIEQLKVETAQKVEETMGETRDWCATQKNVTKLEIRHKLQQADKPVQQLMMEAVQNDPFLYLASMLRLMGRYCDDLDLRYKGEPDGTQGKRLSTTLKSAESLCTQLSDRAAKGKKGSRYVDLFARMAKSVGDVMIGRIMDKVDADTKPQTPPPPIPDLPWLDGVETKQDDDEFFL